MFIRLIPGMPLQRSLRALVIATPGSQPQVEVEEARTGRVIAATRRDRGKPTKRMRDALERRGVETFAFDVGGLQPDCEYVWRADGVRVGAPLSTLPTELPASGASILAASCFYGYFEGAAAMLAGAFTTVARRERSLFRLMVGDNLYADVAPAQRSFDDAFEEAAERYVDYFAREPRADVFTALPSCVTWDDHEFWNDYPEWQPHLPRSWDASFEDYKDAADEALELFQLPLNPTLKPGMRCYSFDLAPLRFFVADTRTRRTRIGNANSRLMPTSELDALTRWLTDAPEGPRVLVLGQPLYTAGADTTVGLRLDHNLSAYTGDYQRILDALRKSPYDVLVISGDVHFSRLLRLEFAGGRAVHEFVTSPACHIPGKVSVAVGSVFGVSQATDDLALDAPPSGFRAPLRATSWTFGCNAPNTFGVLRFKPVGTSVSVGGGFVDVTVPSVPWVRAEGPPSGAVRDARPTSVCAADSLFVLGKRQPLTE